MKRLFCFILLIATLTEMACSQVSTDTLYFGKYKYALTRSKLTYSNYSDAICALPSEYSKTDSIVDISYSRVDSFSYETITMEGDEESGPFPVLLKLYETDTLLNHQIRLANFTDTLHFSLTDLNQAKLYITREKKIIYISSGLFYIIDGDRTIRKQVQKNIVDENIISNEMFGKKYSVGDEIIIKDLYYRVGTATFFLDKQFVIKIH